MTAGAALLSIVVVVGLPSALMSLVGRELRHHAVATAPAASMFIVFNMATLSNERGWFESGQNLLIAGLYGGLVLLLAVVARLPQGFALTAVVSLLALELVAPRFLPERADIAVGNGDATAQETWPGRLRGAAESFTEMPDIYLLIYESYADLETMAYYGFDNQGQISYLESLGFDVLRGTYSNGASTLSSISRLLAAESTIDGGARSFTSGADGVVQALGAAGYETVAINESGYLFEGYPSMYEQTVPQIGSRPGRGLALLQSVLRGELRFEDSYESVEYQEYLDAKRAVLSSQGGPPVFLQTKNKYPGHTQNSGRCQPGELEEYRDNVEKANEEMHVDLLALGTKLDEAIVVIAGDHGPYLTQNCTIIPVDWPSPISRHDVQDRYGTFLAISWPSSLGNTYDIEVLQEVFVAIFAQLSQDETLWIERPVLRETLGIAAGPVRVVDGVVVGGADDGQPLFGGPS
jgi:hypothetical protein